MIAKLPMFQVEQQIAAILKNAKPNNAAKARMLRANHARLVVRSRAKEVKKWISGTR
jgi:hypothetical protein